MQVAYTDNRSATYGIYKYDLADLNYSELYKPTHTNAGLAVAEFI